MPLGIPARRMPIPEEVRGFLGDLLGKPVSVAVSGRVSLVTTPNEANLCPTCGAAPTKPASDLSETDSEEKWVTGLYVDDKNVLIGACVAELKLAAHAGAALAMMSDQVAKEAVAAGDLGENLRDNYYEVVNIVSALLNGPSVPHLRLTEVVDGIPDEVIELSKRAAGHKHYDITIPGYEGGTLGLIGI